MQTASLGSLVISQQAIYSGNHQGMHLIGEENNFKKLTSSAYKNTFRINKKLQ